MGSLVCHAQKSDMELLADNSTVGVSKGRDWTTWGCISALLNRLEWISARLFED